MLPDCKKCENYYTPIICRACLTDVETGTKSRFKEKITVDMVNHPQHYKTETGLETIEVIEAFTSGLDGIEAVDTANIIKYICRWKKKNGLEDLKKAQWYLNHLIKHIEKEND